MSNTSNLGLKQRALLLALEEEKENLLDRHDERIIGRYVWTNGKHETPRTVETLIERGLARRGAGRPAFVFLTADGLAWVAQYWRERADARQHMVDAWRSRANGLEAQVRALGGRP